MMRILIAVALLSVLAPPVFAVDVESIRPFPVVAKGDIPFDFDGARFCAADSGALAEYYFRIPNRYLKFIAAGADSAGLLQAQLELEVEYIDARGHAIETRRDRVTVRSGSAVSAAGGPFQLVTLSYPLNPLAWGVRARVSDLGSKKRGIAYMIRGRHRDGEAWARFTARPQSAAGLCLSDIQFAWQIEASRDTAGLAGDRLHIVPNPSRTYGLKNPTLSFYYEVRRVEPAASEYEVSYTIRREEKEIYRSAPAPVTASSGWSMSEKLDLSSFEPGTYVLSVRLAPPGSASQEESPQAAVSASAFNVLWTPVSWERSEEEILDEAELYLNEEEFRTLEDMAPGERSRFIEQFWLKVDPSPGTPRNEVLEKFLGREDYAKKQYSSVASGSMSDRGRVYVRFGEPDDVRRELIPVEADRLESALQNDPDLDNELKATFSSDRSRPHAYEIWSYYGRGDPLFPDRDLFPGGRQIRFIFVDDQGFGDFRLKYSTEHGVIR